MLEGIRVIECASGIAAPVCCVLLADLGAEVIRIEDPEAKDRARRLSRRTAAEGDGPDVDLAAEANQHSKKGIVLDLKRPEGQAIFRALIARSDIFVTNHPRRIMERLHTDYATLGPLNPRLVYGLLTSYGSRGPDAEMRGADPTAQARSGIMFAMGDRDSKEPVLMNGALFDQLAAVTLAMGVLAALAARERTGKGDLVETSLLQAALYATAGNVNGQLLRGRTSARHSRTRARNVVANFYQCQDGKWIILAEPNPERYWQPFLEVMGLERLNADPRFATIALRREAYRELLAIFEEAFRSRPREEWLRLFRERRLDFVYAPVNDYADVIKDPQVLNNGFLVPHSVPGVGTVQIVGAPLRFASAPLAPMQPAPALGQHTDEVLRRVAGLDGAQLATLRQDGIIR